MLKHYNDRVHSPVNDLLRNPLRILNHFSLIQEKTDISVNWNLSSKHGEAINTEKVLANSHVINELQKGNISTQQALSEIVIINNDKELSQLKENLKKVYQTGLLELHITDVCDLSCLACHYRDKKSATIPFSQLGRILTDLNPKAITITGGGEPNVYSSEDKDLNDVVLEIKKILPNVKLGLINNNTHLPGGEWLKYIQWQRSSVDAASSSTYAYLKGRDSYAVVVENVEKLLKDSAVPFVGVGFLYRKENLSEIYDFLKQWFNWFSKQPETIQKRFNIQFRPISPQIESLSGLRIGQQQFIDSGSIQIFKEQIEKINYDSEKETSFKEFLLINTNYTSLKNTGTDFLHNPTEFNNCFNALIHRVFRATGEEYPDFLLCNHPHLAMGNTLHGDKDEIFKIALLELWYFNKKSPYCNADNCRQGWVSKVVEDYKSGKIRKAPAVTDYFF